MKLEERAWNTIALTTSDDGVAWLRLDRPDAANARNQEMRLELVAAYEAIRASDEVRVLVLSGTGNRFFCAGMDLKEAGRIEHPLERRERLVQARDIELLAELNIPTIAAINGFALGGGLEMALACDIRMAAEDAELGFPEVSRGLIPGGGATQRLPVLVGPARAYELLYLGKRIDGVRASEFGLINRAVARDELDSTVQSVAADIAAHPRAAVGFLKAAVRNGLEVSASSARSAEFEMLLTLLADRASRSNERA